MTDISDVAISRKSDFRIFIENEAIVIEDAEHKRGGNLLTNGGKWISWWNDTGGTCRLIFRQFLDEGGSGDGEPAWPFVPDQDPLSNEREIPKALQTGMNPWRGKLAGVRQLACFEYKVEVEMDDGRRYELDPVIIVRT
jgi:hypothetical protein